VLVLSAIVLSLLGTELWLRHVHTPRAVQNRIDIATRGTGTDSSLLAVRSDGQFQHFLPGQEARLQHAEYDTSIQIDDLGWRRTSPEVVHQYQVVFAGDSFTFGIGLNDSQSFPWRFGARLGISVGNLGVPGLDPVSMLDLIGRNHRRIGAPALYFIVLFVGNDFGPVLNSYHSNIELKSVMAPAFPRTLADRLINTRSMQAINRFIFHDIGGDSYLVQLVKVGINRLLRMNQSNSDGRIQDEAGTILYLAERPKGLEQDLRAAWTWYADLIQGVSKELGSNAAVILIPDKSEINLDRIAEVSNSYAIDQQDFDLSLPRRVISHALSATSISFFDTTECLRPPDMAVREAYYYTFDNHLTPLGADAFVDCALSFVSTRVAESVVHQRAHTD
jgi:hypothetical protein